MEIEINILKDIDYGLAKVLSGKVEHLPQAKLAKKMVEDLIIYLEEKDLLGRQSFKVIEK